MNYKFTNDKKKDFKVLKGCSTHHLHGVSSPTVDNQTLFTNFKEKAVLNCKVFLSKKNLLETSKGNGFAALCEAASEF